MGHAVGGRHAGVVGAVLAMLAGLLAVSPTAAVAEPPVTDLLVAPDGAELVTRDGGNRSTDHGDFLHLHEDLDVTVVDGASGAIRYNGDLGILVTVVRLATERQAAEALSALARPVSAEELAAGREQGVSVFGDAEPHVEALPAPRAGAVGRRAVTGSFSVVEFARATGRDLVVLAQLDGSIEPHPVLHAALDAHRMAFPDVTMPADAASSPPWVAVGAGAAAVLAAAGVLLVVTRTRRGSRPRRRPGQPASAVSSTTHPDGAPTARMNW